MMGIHQPQEALFGSRISLEEITPHHSVLSKARRRWGKKVFQQIFVRTVQQCVEAGLVEGRKIHVDSSLLDAHAAKDSILKSSPELVAAYKKIVQAQETKLDETVTPESYVVSTLLPWTLDQSSAATASARRRVDEQIAHR